MTMLHSTANGNVAYKRIDSEHRGSVPVLFLHGALGAMPQFDAMLPRFADRAQFLMDFPSHGQSTITADSTNTNTLAQHTLEMLDHWDIAQVDIIGYSMGGYVGLELACMAPKRVRSVVSHGMKFYWTPESIDASVAELDSEVIRKRSEKGHAALTRMHETNTLDRTIMLTRSVIETFRTYGLDVEALKTVKTPVLLSIGDRDELVPLPEVLRLYQELGYEQASLAIHPNTRHMLHFIPLDSFEWAVRHFWKKLG